MVIVEDKKIDGSGWNATFIKSLTVEEAVTEIMQPQYDHLFEGMNKKDRTAEIKEIHKICTK